jgi:hypothetical protein
MFNLTPADQDRATRDAETTLGSVALGADALRTFIAENEIRAQDAALQVTGRPTTASGGDRYYAAYYAALVRLAGEKLAEL